MTHVLVTFLGAPDRGHPPTQHRRSGYQEIDYKFSDAEVYRARLSPLALLKFLRGKARRDDLVPPPDALVVFGTSGSAWHELMLCACGCWPDRDSIDRLVRRSHADSLTADDLNAFQDHDLLKSVLGVTSVRLELLPYADKAGEQVAIIAALNQGCSVLLA